MLYSPSRFLRLSYFSLIFVVAVIVWGAFVRSSGSGAGCGAHWPLCDGAIVPHSVFFERMVEYTHRATSGLALLAVIFQFYWSRKIPKNYGVTRASCVASLILILIEAAVGAGLVLFELVEDNDSMARAVVIAVHLVNSMLLLASLAVTPWSFRYKVERFGKLSKSEFSTASVLILLMLVVGASGAVTALGNTIFPSTDLLNGIRDDFSSSSHFLIRLRIIHPILACVLAALLIQYCNAKISEYANGDLRNRLARYLILMTGIQVTMGVANVVLLAPTWLQMLHLIGADLCWMLLILLIGHQSAFASRLGKDGTQEADAPEPSQRMASNH